MTRGFVTVATGKDEYYKQARNLLRSFRLHNPNVKFAILCDRENEYTSGFDDVVILRNASFSYRDKFRLLTDCPYDENIFIETDCLVYRNLEFFWTLLAQEWDFSSFGWNDGKIDTWIQNDECIKGICKLMGGRMISSIPIFNPGYLFIRRGASVKKMYEDISIMENYLIGDWKNDQVLFVNGNLRDDPLFCLAMEFNGMRCAAKPSRGKCLAVPSGYKYLNVDILGGKLKVRDRNGKEIDDCSLLHFSARRVAEEGLYPWQVAILNADKRRFPQWLLHALETKCAMKLFCIICIIRRNIKRVKSKLENADLLEKQILHK